MPVNRTNGHATEQLPPSSVPPGIEEGDAAQAAPHDPLAPLMLLLQQLSRQILLYVATCSDQARLLVRFGVYRAVTALLLLIIGTTSLMVACALFLIGASTGLGLLLGGQNWLGQLLIGALILTSAAGTLLTWHHRQKSAALQEMIRKYEHGVAPTPQD